MPSPPLALFLVMLSKAHLTSHSRMSGFRWEITPSCVVAATAAKSLQSCPTLCDPRDSSPPGSPVPGILQARTLEWVAISFSNAWKWKVKVKLLSHVWLLVTPRLQPTRLLRPWDFPNKSTGVGCHFLLQGSSPPRDRTWVSRIVGRCLYCLSHHLPLN